MRWRCGCGDAAAAGDAVAEMQRRRCGGDAVEMRWRCSGGDAAAAAGAKHTNRCWFDVHLCTECVERAKVVVLLLRLQPCFSERRRQLASGSQHVRDCRRRRPALVQHAKAVAAKLVQRCVRQVHDRGTDGWGCPHPSHVRHCCCAHARPRSWVEVDCPNVERSESLGFAGPLGLRLPRPAACSSNQPTHTELQDRLQSAVVAVAAATAANRQTDRQTDAQGNAP